MRQATVYTGLSSTLSLLSLAEGIFKFITHILRYKKRYVSIYGSTALCWALAAFQFLNLLRSR
jgi:hypothetical protein